MQEMQAGANQIESSFAINYCRNSERPILSSSLSKWSALARGAETEMSFALVRAVGVKNV